MISIEACRLRVLFHSERIFRSAGGRGSVAHAKFLMAATKHCLTDNVDMYSRADCITALRLIEEAARSENMHLYRNVHTYWEQLQ